jgi:hypothetical protein
MFCVLICPFCNLSHVDNQVFRLSYCCEVSEPLLSHPLLEHFSCGHDMESLTGMGERIIDFFVRAIRISHTDPALGLMPRWRIACLQMTWAFYLHCWSYFRTMNSQYCKMGILMNSDFWNSSRLLKHVLVIFVLIFLVIGQSEPGLLFMPLRNVGMCLIIDM